MDNFIYTGRSICYQREMRDKTGDLFDPVIDPSDFTPANVEVKQIEFNQARDMILKYEWLGTMPSSAFYCVGLFYKDVLSAVEVFSSHKPGGPYTLFKYPAICLSRGCCASWCPSWVSSYLISKALKMVQTYLDNKPHYVLAYSDWDAGEIGTVYQATNWYYLGHHKNDEWREPNGKKHDRRYHRDLAKTRDPNYKITGKVDINI